MTRELIPPQRGRDGHGPVVHLTTAHAPNDNRIFLKECRTLAAAQFDVVLIAPAYRGAAPAADPTAPPVRVEAFPPAANRRRRMITLPFQVYRKAARQRGSVYHIHDPELVPVALLLKARRKARVVYDAHEDLAAQVLTKPWIPRPARQPVSRLAHVIERTAGRAFDLVVAATPSIEEKYPQHKTVLVQNMPRLGELLAADRRPFADRPRLAAYVGLLNALRGAAEMLAAASQFGQDDDFVLSVAGICDPPGLVDELAALPGADHLRILGVQSRPEVRRLLADARVGVLPFLPAPNHLGCLPTKLFEYMAAGLPVVASDLPGVREVITSTRCGLVVDPRRPREFADAIRFFLDNPENAEVTGQRGLRAVESTYNWAQEAERLVTAYARLFRGAPAADGIVVSA